MNAFHMEQSPEGWTMQDVADWESIAGPVVQIRNSPPRRRADGAAMAEEGKLCIQDVFSLAIAFFALISVRSVISDHIVVYMYYIYMYKYVLHCH